MKRFFRSGWGILTAIVLTLALVAGIWLGVARLTDPYDGRIAPGVTLGGLEIGNMTPRQAKAALKEGLGSTILAQELTISLPEESLILSPGELEIQLDVGAAVRAAKQVGRKEGCTETRLGLLPYLTLDREGLRARLEGYAQRHDSTLTQPSYRLEGNAPDLSTQQAIEAISCQTLVLTLGTPEARLNVDSAAALVLDAYDTAFTGIRDVCLEVPASVLPEAPDLEAIAREICRQPVDDAPDFQTYGLQYGSYGYGFDENQARQAIAQADFGQSVSLPMTCSAPAVQGDTAFFQDVLGFCDTKHNTNENRNNNLRLLSQALNGYILQPGEEFSYNAVVGERTSERGYLPAPAYSGNRLADAVGGGVCQGSSTLYNCALLADLEITCRICHGATINYLPLGLDAAVNWGTTDFCFRNNWNFPIMLQAEVTDEYLCMKILGTDEKDYYLELSANSWRDGSVTYARSYKHKFDKESGELISKDLITYSTYYHF